MDYRALAKKLLQERPQTMAVMLARLAPEHSSEIVKLLPAYVQSDLLDRIVQVDHLPEEVLEEIDSQLALLLRRH